MNCHEDRNKFKLLGVFKETDGLTDWAEQLFKHEGFCLWTDDGSDSDLSDYEFMQERREYWVGDCTQMSLSDSEGNTLYLDTMPLPGGNMTYGLYTDKACSQESLMTFSEYVIQYYSTYYYNTDGGTESSAYWESVFARWNELMSVYKICQPCRSYRKVVTTNDQSSTNGDDNDQNNNGYNNNDGGGEEEQYGYNCYDDAGYRNCNQCYKFETKTEMKPATSDDLDRASAQGMILAIRVNGTVYGRGIYESSELHRFQSIFSEHILLGVVLGTLTLFLIWSIKGIMEWCQRRRSTNTLPASLTEVLSEPVLQKGSDLKEVLSEPVLPKGSDITDATASTSDQSDAYVYRIWKTFQRDKEKLQSELASKEESLARQKELIEQLTFALVREKTMRNTEEYARDQHAIEKSKQKEGHSNNGSDESRVIDVTNVVGRLNARGFFLDRMWRKFLRDRDAHSV
jgi:hypothetical protein